MESEMHHQCHLRHGLLHPSVVIRYTLIGIALVAPPSKSVVNDSHVYLLPYGKGYRLDETLQ